MHKNAMKYNKTQSKWCENKHVTSKIIDTFETYQFHSQENFVKASEVDQELECGMHQTKSTVMIGCDMDWTP
jgi:hypothetical protein